MFSISNEYTWPVLAFILVTLFNGIDITRSNDSWIWDETIAHDDSNDNNELCVQSETTASGPYAPKGPYCSGDLIFQEEFNDFDLKLWHHEITLAGGHVNYFQIETIRVLLKIELFINPER